MRRSERGLILTRPGSTAREKRPNLVTRPTLPCDTGLYGLGQMMQQGMAPQKPTKLPRLLTSHCCQCTIDELIAVKIFWKTYSLIRTSHAGPHRRSLPARSAHRMVASPRASVA